MTRMTSWNERRGDFDYTGGTRYTSIIIRKDGTWSVLEHRDVASAESFELNTRTPNMRAESYGDINGSDYTVVYYPDEKTEGSSL